MAHSIYGEKEGEYREFYRRRIWRIYPTYLACFALACVVLWMHRGESVIRISGGDYPILNPVWSVLGAVAFLGGIVAPHFFLIGVNWSLNIEVLFYALTPLLRRIPTRPLLVAIAISAFCYYNHSVVAPGELLNRMLWGKAALLLGWLWLLGFVFYRHRTEAWAQIILVLAGNLMLSRWDQAPRGYGIYDTFSYSLVAICLIAAPQVPTAWIKPLNYLGDLSYPLYLVHAPLIFLLCSGNPSLLRWWLFIVLSFAGAMFVLHAVDYPSRRLAKRLSGKSKSELQPPLEVVFGAGESVPANTRIPSASGSREL